MIRRCAFGALVLVCLWLTLAAFTGPVRAQSSSPSPATGPSASGQVTGALSAGSTLTVSVDASIPRGWEALHLIEASILSGGQELERLRFDIEDNKLTVGDQDIVVGTGAVAAGRYLHVSGTDVVVTTGGANLSFEVDAKVVRVIPDDARFALGVVDDFGESDEVTRGLAEPPSGGLTWETVIALIAAALFIGGFIGNLFASRLRPPVRPSIYDTVQRRLQEERAAGTSGS